MDYGFSIVQADSSVFCLYVNFLILTASNFIKTKTISMMCHRCLTLRQRFQEKLDINPTSYSGKIQNMSSEILFLSSPVPKLP